jgi:glycosyltransferase domain-containing protein
VTPEEVALLSELTIIIPTYNRPLELERAIEYWRDTPVAVHILDGSEKPWFPIGVFSGTNTISYNHVPQNIGESSAGNYSRRIALATELAKTNYSALCSDDDFFTIPGLVFAIQALKNDKSDVVIGRCAQYLFREENFEWKRINWDWRSDELSLSSVIWDRFASNSKGSTYYGIYKTPDWKKIRLSSVQSSFSHVGAIENISNFLTKRALRVLFIDSYLWITNYPDKKYPNYKVKKMLQKFSDWLNEPRNKQEVQTLLLVLESGFKKFLPEDMSHLSRLMAKKVLVDKVAPKDLSFSQRLRTNFSIAVLKVMSSLPEFFRRTVFSLLTDKWKKVLRTPDFVDSRTPVVDIDSNDPVLAEAIRNWERILLMPREELRLRANI